MQKIDRIDNRGDIREHFTRDGAKTICGLALSCTQSPADNRPCKRCERIVATQCQKPEAVAS
jgi:hypothetical protein